MMQLLQGAVDVQAALQCSVSDEFLAAVAERLHGGENGGAHGMQPARALPDLAVMLGVALVRPPRPTRSPGARYTCAVLHFNALATPWVSVQEWDGCPQPPRAVLRYHMCLAGHLWHCEELCRWGSFTLAACGIVKC